MVRHPIRGSKKMEEKKKRKKEFRVGECGEGKGEFFYI
jgi:hypothetical protein